MEEGALPPRGKQGAGQTEAYDYYICILYRFGGDACCPAAPGVPPALSCR